MQTEPSRAFGVRPRTGSGWGRPATMTLQEFLQVIDITYRHSAEVHVRHQSPMHVVVPLACTRVLQSPRPAALLVHCRAEVKLKLHKPHVRELQLQAHVRELRL